MFVYFERVCFVVVAVSDLIVADFVPINWNKSVTFGNSHLEREYKYPMFEEVAPFPCDLSDTCDAFCCHDADCDENEKKNFQCEESAGNCAGVLSFFDCNCDNFEKPEWFSLFCYVFKNPVYLGKFFTTSKKIERITTFQNLIGRKIKNYFNYHNAGDALIKSVNEYKFGSPVMTYVPTSDSLKFPSVSALLRKVPIKDSSFTCKTSSVNYRVNDVTVCHTKITEELCQNGISLSVIPYLIQDSTSYSYNNTPLVLKNLDFLEGVETEVTLKCALSTLFNKKFRKQKLYFFEQDIMRQCDESFPSFLTVWSNGTCQNVLMYVGYKFIVNGSDIIQLNVDYGLTNLSLINDPTNNYVTEGNIYFKQTFNVTFIDIMKSNIESSNISRQDELFNRGYFVGEELNFGYKRWVFMTVKAFN